jgi:hypothetical protein
MAVALKCSCGADFEVEDTFAGQSVGCPDCNATLRVPLLRPTPTRTSHLAIASMVIALLGAFTIVGTVLATLLGIAGLMSIARNRNTLSGASYAVAGIVMGILFTVVTSFAFSSGQLFDGVRDLTVSSRVDRTGPLEVIRAKDGFAIRRPSKEWGVASDELMKEVSPEGLILLVEPRKAAYVEVTKHDADGQSLEKFRDLFLDGFKDNAPGAPRKNMEDLGRPQNFKLQGSQRLPALADGSEVLEVQFTVKIMGQNLAYLVHLVKPKRSAFAYAVTAWAYRSRMSRVEEELRKALDSFRLL